MKIIMKQCPNCKKKFKTNYKWHVYCSRGCQIVAWNNRTGYWKRYYRKNKHKYIQYAKKWRENNKERWKSYSRKYQKKYWQEYRKKHPEKINSRWYRSVILNTFGNKCTRCNSYKNLVIHHKTRDYFNSSIKDVEVVCRKCHEIIHSA